MQTPSEVQTAFKEKGLDFSIHEIVAIGDIINKITQNNITSLSEDDLNEISGGGKAKAFFKGMAFAPFAVPQYLADKVAGKHVPISPISPSVDDNSEVPIAVAGSAVGSGVIGLLAVAVAGTAIYRGAKRAIKNGGVKWGPINIKIVDKK